MTTTLENKTSILAELWLDYRGDEQFQDFIEYNDIGLPLAYVIANRIVEPTEKSNSFIEETFELFLKGLDLEDTGFQNLEEIFS